MTVPQDRRGFALPLAVLIIAALTAAIAAGFAATSGEAVVNNAQRSQERAYQLAEAGLQQFLVRRGEPGFCAGCVADPSVADSEYTRVPLGGGYADIVAYRVRSVIAGISPAVYFIRSKGVDTAARLSGSAAPFAERTVGIYANWNTTTILPIGALTSLNGVTRTNATITGNDGCTSSSSANLSIGLALPFGSGTSSVGLPLPYPSVDSGFTFDSLKASLAIDWNGIINGGVLTPDYTVPPDPWPTSFSNWPLIRLKRTDSIRTPSSGTPGQGIIIADSNLLLKRPYDWRGALLVGGKLSTTGGGTATARVDGGVVTGLNLLLPGAIPPSPGQTSDNDILPSGSYDLYYNSCYLASAGIRFHKYSVMPNTWMDNVAAW